MAAALLAVEDSLLLRVGAGAGGRGIVATDIAAETSVG